MTLDISNLLRFVALSTWTGRHAEDFAQTLAKSSNLDVDFDLEAGEDWLRLLKHDKAVGLIHTLRPLVIIEPDVAIPPRREGVVVLVVSMSLSACDLTASPEALGAAFPPYSSSPVLAGNFSFEDLWFSTV